MHTIEISDQAYENAKRIAALDGIDVEMLIESLVQRHAEYIAFTLCTVTKRLQLQHRAALQHSLLQRCAASDLQEGSSSLSSSILLMQRGAVAAMTDAGTRGNEI